MLTLLLRLIARFAPSSDVSGPALRLVNCRGCLTLAVVAEVEARLTRVYGMLDACSRELAVIAAEVEFG